MLRGLCTRWRAPAFTGALSAHIVTCFSIPPSLTLHYLRTPHSRCCHRLLARLDQTLFRWSSFIRYLARSIFCLPRRDLAQSSHSYCSKLCFCWSHQLGYFHNIFLAFLSCSGFITEHWEYHWKPKGYPSSAAPIWRLGTFIKLYDLVARPISFIIHS